MEELLRVGIITTSHGVKGEVKVFPTTDGPERFKKIKEVILKTNKEEKNVLIENCKIFKQYAILKFQDFSSIEDIEKYKGAELWIKRNSAQTLRRNEFYVADLIGMDVYLDTGDKFGTLSDVMETGANDVYIIKIDVPDKYNQQETILIPAIKECILDINTDDNKMTIHLMEGLV